MKKIQVDMFAVGLGAAILTQFSLKDGNRVTVLADGGGLTDQKPEAVVKKLPKVLDEFKPGSKPHLDLIVGTHYDGDHLKGLIPIIEESSINIGEIWLPPIKNDGPRIPGTIEADKFLADLFFSDDDGKQRRDYLLDKSYEVRELYELEMEVLEIFRQNNRRIPLSNYVGEGRNRSIEDLNLGELDRLDSISKFREFFESHRDDAMARTGFRPIHEAESYDSQYLSELELWKEIQSRLDIYLWLDSKHLLRTFVREAPSQARLVPAVLASIRKVKTEDAITATHLNDVIDALRKRGEQFRPRCRLISDDRPNQLVWSSSKRRFVSGEGRAKDDLMLKLLGPSDRLVQKLSHKIPVATYAFAMMRIPDLTYRENITPSNRLSYIFTLEMDGQKVLISGDAGCYGFKDKGKFIKELLRPMESSQVVQVAHHGGRNYDFYRALIAAGFADEKGPAFLLLSHEPDSEFRPSDAFREFMDLLNAKRQEVRLLFTSKPAEANIRDYTDNIYHAVSAVSKEGDIRLSYYFRRRPALKLFRKAGWQVEKHSIEV